jgi:hypothetical protein
MKYSNRKQARDPGRKAARGQGEHKRRDRRMDAYKDFTARLKLLASKYPDLITMTLSNIFTMRLIGNKTHGDLAEIAIAEFINQYMYDF